MKFTYARERAAPGVSDFSDIGPREGAGDEQRGAQGNGKGRGDMKSAGGFDQKALACEQLKLVSFNYSLGFRLFGSSLNALDL